MTATTTTTPSLDPLSSLVPSLSSSSSSSSSSSEDSPGKADDKVTTDEWRERFFDACQEDSMQLAVDLVQRACEDDWRRKSLESLAHRILQELLRLKKSNDTEATTIGFGDEASRPKARRNCEIPYGTCFLSDFPFELASACPTMWVSEGTFDSISSAESNFPVVTFMSDSC